MRLFILANNYIKSLGLKNLLKGKYSKLKVLILGIGDLNTDSNGLGDVGFEFLLKNQPGELRVLSVSTSTIK